MKAINFWKTFACTALALAALTGCSKDDAENNNEGIPVLTVNGKAAETVGVDLDGGMTSPVIKVESNMKWVLTFETIGANTWITPSALEGVGSVNLTFTVASNATEREAKIKLLSTGFVSGIPIQKSVDITIKQTKGGDPVGETNVAEIRALLKAMNPTETKGPVTAEIAAKTIKGVVVSNAATDNLGNKYLIAISDTKGLPNAGLTVNATKFKDMALAPGTVVSASLAGAQVGTFKGLVQLSIAADVEISTSAGTALAPITVTVDKVFDYESQYIKIETCQASEGAYGVAWYVAGDGKNKGNVNFETKSGLAFVVRTSQYASYKGDIVPDKSGYIQGVAGRFNEDIQVSPQSAADIAGLTEARMQPDYKVVTINNLAAGNFQVNASIVGVHSKGVMLADNAGGTTNYVMGFYNGGLQSDAVVNKLAEMKGTCADRFGLWQFAEPNLVVKGDQSFTLPAAVNFDAAAIAAYPSAVKYQYVTLTGAVTITNVPASGSTAAYNKYDLDVAGVPADVTVNLAYAIDSYFTSKTIVSGDVINVKGFAIGYDTNAKKLSIMVREVEKNTNTPSVVITTTPTTFVAAGEAQAINFTKANLGSNKVYAKITGTDAAQFTVAAGEVTGTSVSVTAKANATADAKNATLEIYAAPSEGAAAVVTATVAIKQAAQASGTAKYTKVTAITAGKKYLLVADAGAKKYIFDPANFSNGKVTGEEIAVANNVIASDAANDACAVTIAATAEFFTIQLVADNRYVEYVSSTNLALNSTSTKKWAAEQVAKNGTILFKDSATLSASTVRAFLYQVVDGSTNNRFGGYSAANADKDDNKYVSLSLYEYSE